MADPLNPSKSIRALPWADFLWIASIALIYFLVARFSLTLLFKPEGIAAVWPPSGIFLSAVLLSRKKIRPYLIGALFLTDLAGEILAGTPPAASLVYSASLAGGTALGAWLLVRYCREPITFRRIREVVGFLFISVLFSSALTSFAAALIVKVFLGAPLESSWFLWQISNPIGNLLTTPLIMSLAYAVKTHFKKNNARQLIEGAVLLLVMVLLNAYAFAHFRSDNRLALLLNLFTFPFLIWASLRLGVMGAVSASFILAVIILRNAIAGNFPLVGTMPYPDMIVLIQLYIATLSVSSLFLAALIAERKVAEEALREGEEKFKYIFDNSIAGKSITRLSGEMHANKAFCEMLGYSPEELQSKKWQEITHPDDIETTQKVVDALLSGEKESARFNKRYFHKNGSIVWADVSTSLRRDKQGQPLYLMTTLMDITARMHAEEALLHSEKRFRALIENSADAISLINAGGVILYDSPSYRRLLGFREEERLGRNTFELVHPDDRENLSHLFAGMLQKPEQVVLPPTRVRHADGSWHWIEGVANNLLAEPSVQAIVVNFRDITERKRAEEALNNTLADLERSNQELEQFAYIASHDLQEPLRMISSYTQLLAQRYKGKLDKDADEFIGYAVDGADHMRRLINDLLAYSRVGTRGKPPESVPADAALERALENLQFAIQENRAEITRDPLPTVLVDDVQLAQVFQNLIANAIKFRRKESPRIRIAAEDRGTEWVFSVRDNGIGIEPQYLDRIFIIFQRFHERGKYPGTGIGLALCKKIVLRHGGRIWAESKPDEGSTFYFTLPKTGRK
jgi:PAS domain S-box-containing protein